MALTAEQLSERSRLRGTGNLLAILGLAPLAIYGATAGATIWATCMFIGSLSCHISASQIGMPRRAGAAAPAGNSSPGFWSGLFIGSLFRPRPSHGVHVVHGAAPRGRVRGSDLPGARRVYPPEPKKSSASAGWFPSHGAAASRPAAATKTSFSSVEGATIRRTVSKRR